MIDNITLTRIEVIHPNLKDELTKIYREIVAGNVNCRFVQVFRTFEEQDALYAQGRTKPGKIVTAAKGGQSYHNYGLAVDFCLLNDKNGDGKISGDEIVWDRNTDLDKDSIIDWMEVVKVFTNHGWTWGASFKDYPHFEKNFGQNWRKLLIKYQNKDFIPGTKYVNL